MTFLKEEPYGTVKAFFLSAAVWFVIGPLIGFIDATHLVAPDLLGNISWLVFGRTRPMHTNVVIFGFVGTALLGSAFYLVPTLLRSPLYSERLGKFSLWVWNLTIISGTVTLSLGYSQGREYAEWIWPVDMGVLLCFCLFFYNLFRTAQRRQEKTLYVSIWYIFAGLVYIFLIYFFGNAVWNPSTGAITGLPDAILAWFYGHGVVGLFLTPLAVALAYYIIPIVCRSPLYSHSLSLVGFWTILVLYTHIGAHHLLQTPLPTWLKVVAITGSLGMFIPVLTVLINLWLTMRGRLGLDSCRHRRQVRHGRLWSGILLPAFRVPLQALPIAAAGNPSDQLGGCPLPTWAFSAFPAPLPWAGSILSCPDNRTSPLQPPLGRYPVLAGAHRHVRLFSGPDRGRPDPGARLAERARQSTRSSRRFIFTDPSAPPSVC